MAVERDQPRISVNKLGEYMLARARRRRRIIIDQREPKDFIRLIYPQAEEAIARFLVAGATDRSIITSAVERLTSERADTDWKRERNALCVDALEAFLDIADDFDLEGFERTAGDAGGGFSVGGVYVSVRPEVLLRQTDARGGVRLGAIKLYLVKSYPHSDESAGYVGASVLEYLRRERPDDGKPDPELCLVVDVFGGEIFTAPRASKSRLADIEAACEEIAGRWSS